VPSEINVLYIAALGFEIDLHRDRIPAAIDCFTKGLMDILPVGYLLAINSRMVLLEVFCQPPATRRPLTRRRSLSHPGQRPFPDLAVAGDLYRR